jgi:hypothetical protein
MLLLSLDGPPRLLWHSIDSRMEEIPPSEMGTNGEVTGRNYAYHQRTVALHKGLVYVSKVQRKGKFYKADPRLTPTTPGYYQYWGSRFRRVAAPR